MRKSLMAAVVFFLAAPVSPESTSIYFDSEPGDYIGQGDERLVEAADGEFSARSALDGSVEIFFLGDTFWRLRFAPPEGVPFAVGVYENATRYPFQDPDVPGLSVGGDGRGCNELTGRFIVHEIEVVGQDVLSFAADFEQHCEGGDAALFGSVRFRSTKLVLSTWVNEKGFGPTDPIRIGIGLDNPGLAEIADYYFGFVLPDGDSVVFLNASFESQGGRLSDLSSIEPFASGLDLSTPSSGHLRSFLSFHWSGAEPEGRYVVFFTALLPGALEDDVLEPEEVLATSGAIFDFPRYTFIYLDSEPGDYIGQGQTRLITRADGLFRGDRNFDEGASFFFSSFALGGSSFWSLDFAAPGSVPLEPGYYPNATRFPFQEPTEAGLSVSGDGRGCNRLTGRFIIWEFVFAGEGIERFAADFEQHCEGGDPALFGAIRFNSTILVGGESAQPSRLEIPFTSR